MILYLDTSENKKTLIKVGRHSLIKKYTSPDEQKILLLLASFLKSKKISPKKIKEIKVKLKGNSYTSLRLGCAIANTLAWALGIKVNRKEQVVPLYERKS